MSASRLIALPVEEERGLDSEICPHFGHAPAFALVEVEGDRIGTCSIVANPMAEQHQPGMLPRFVQSLGANVLLAGGMGPRAVDLLRHFGIEVATGAEGRVRDAVTAFLAGRLSGTSPCNHGHHAGGGCGGHGHHGHSERHGE
ncbi:NifB/NifX family molybdenum-iron cluster-binding protein [Myxococcota bacterium]|jgi:predicted Fe-Mo cluster-binding NifX family protein|nr:NifB/NifX family molybdenum-iron cluster-binding protein [Myxococcota bacterium]